MVIFYEVVPTEKHTHEDFGIEQCTHTAQRCHQWLRLRLLATDIVRSGPSFRSYGTSPPLSIAQESKMKAGVSGEPV